MKVAFFLTKESGKPCGVGDYTYQVAQALEEQGICVTLEEFPKWSIPFMRAIKRRYKDDTQTLFHLQYPTLGMGLSFAPFLLPLLFYRHKVVITLHEFKQFHWIRKLYCLIPSLLGTKFIFTNEFERDVFCQVFPWTKTNCSIIPIGNNIRIIPNQHTTPQDTQRLVYFGQIVEGKGIEDFLETIQHLRKSDNKIPCAIIGALLDPSSEITKKVQSAAKENNIDCLFNLSAEDVSKELHKSSIAFLPFPEGVGDKRGSALACLKHGLTVITKHSDLTPQWWRETTHHAQTSKEAASMIEMIRDGKIEKTKAPAILQKALDEREWSQIALMHINLYKTDY